jgi:hypothetical protein
VCTLSFWYLATTNATLFTAQVQGNATLLVTTNVTPLVTPGYTNPPVLISAATNYATPGAANTLIKSLPPFPPLWLNEIQPLNLTGITNSLGQHAPWLELYNAGTNVVVLTNLYLSDDYTNLNKWPFTSGAAMGPGEFKVIFADGQTNLSTTNELHTSFTLGTNGGGLALSRLDGTNMEVLDYLDYGVIRGDLSYGSYPDGQPFDRRLFANPTPGRTNDGSAVLLPVVVNEWMAVNNTSIIDPADGHHEDWFELYNAGPDPVALDGYYLTDSSAAPTQFRIPAGYAIGPFGYLLVWADNVVSENNPANPDLHVNFKLSGAGGSIGMYAPDGRPIDLVSYGVQTADVSMGRCPDGNPNIVVLPVATPRAANVCVSNAPPTLQAIGDKYVYLGETLVFTAVASDPESPPEVLSFSLDAGAPLGATIGALSGVFTWTPDAAQAPGTYPITVRVTDNGVPPASAAQALQVEVLLPPDFSSSTLNGYTLSLTVPSVPGRSYQLVYKLNLSDATWTPSGSPVPGTGNLLLFQVDVRTALAQFFKIVVLP